MTKKSMTLADLKKSFTRTTDWEDRGSFEESVAIIPQGRIYIQKHSDGNTTFVLELGIEEKDMNALRDFIDALNMEKKDGAKKETAGKD